MHIISAQKNQQQLEERYRLIVEEASDGIFIMDYDARYIDVNNSGCIMLGYSKEEILRMSVHDVLPEGEQPIVKQRGEELLAGETIISECFLRKKDGTFLCAEVSFKMLPDGNVMGITRDISERLRTEQVLRLSEKKYRTLIEQATDGIFVADQEGRFQVVNESCSRLSGYTIEELLNMNFRELTDKEDVKNNPFHFDELRKGKNVITERLMRNKTGKTINIEINARLLDNDRLLVFIRDITERKMAGERILKEKELSDSVINNMPGVFYLYDKSGKFLRWNKNFEALTGYTSKEISSMHPLDFYDTDEKQRIKERIAAVFAGKTPDIEVFVFTKGKKKIPVFINSVCVQYEDRPCILGMGIDITEKKNTEEKLKQNLEQLKTLSRLSEAVSQAKNPEDIYELAISSLKQTIKVDRASVLLFNENGIMQFVASSGLSDKYKKAASGHSPWTPDEKDPAPLFISNVSNDPSLAQLLPVIKREGICALGFIPLVYQGRLLGKFMLYFNTEHHFTDEEIHLAKTIAKDVAFAIGEKKSEIILRESENRMRTILDTNPECIKLLSPRCELNDINRAGLEMIEADSLEQVKGLSLLSVVTDSHKKPVENLIREAFEDRSGCLEFEMKTLKGKSRWCEVSVVPFRDAAGKIINALGVTRDISEKKKAEFELILNEKKYRTLVEQAVDAIALYDLSGKVLDVNTGSANLLGYTKEELIGISLKEILTEEEFRDNSVWFYMLQQGKSTVKQRKMKRKDGSVVHTEVRSQQLPDGRFLSVIRDLTERIVAKEELEASYKAVRKLTSHLQNIREEERKHIAREIHDELGQQLTVLKMDISWLSKKISPDADTSIKQKIKELLAMLDGTVKTVRRISSELRPSLLDDLGLVAAMEWQLGEFEKRSGIKTSFTEPDKEIQLADHIKTGLFRIFQESLTNVARHADAQKVKVSFQSAGNDFILRIADDGKGFDKHKVADKKTLGILGMKERTSMIGGTYNIISSPEKGTTVVVTIPMDS